ncbi:protein kinase [Streptomyces sp. NPDC050788]|uniref:serine/threonine-protein kinase n=1 Tax=Streptomyces sp. NPDC050788 TaxID=3155041 RepID=UPI003435E518
MSSGETTNGNGQADGTGRLLAGRYRVVAQLGRGGMGVVWRAVDEVLGREVAVKELRTYTDADGPELADLRLRMQREARAAARVRHPGVVAVHDVAEVDGRPLIVMELVDGPSLDDVLRERGALDAREAAGIGAKVMDALAAAHRAGVLHRDVKPGNILLDRSGRVVLTDFGIATMDDPGDGSATHLTRSGEIVGSLDYLAPERAQGADPGPASDVWALGATLFAAVEGSSPFRRTSTYSTLAAIVTEPLPEPRRAGPLGPVLQRLLDKRPETRPEAEQGRDLLQAVADMGDADTPTAPLRGETEPRPTTEPSLPVVPPGFGPVQSPGAPEPDTVQPGRAEQTGSGTPGSGSGRPPGPVYPAFGAPEQAAGPTGQGGYGAGPDAGGQGAYGPGPAGQAAQGHSAHHAASGDHTAPSPPAGFGPPAPMGQYSSSAPTGTVPASPQPRRKSRALLAAAAVVVVLAAAGTTVAVLNARSGTEDDARSSGSVSGAPASGATNDRTDADRSGAPEPTKEKDGKGATESEDPDGKGGKKPSGRATSSAPAKSSGGGTTGGGSGGSSGGGSGGGTTGGGSGDGGTTGGGGSTTPAPACTSIGGGKYNCTVWRTAKSYTASGAEAGVLNAGTNYFYCQQNLGRRETSGQWTNVWWAKTDDDSGNTNVWVSDVYIKGGNNDEPVPGLPVC